MIDLLATCAQSVDQVTMSAVVKQESGGQPWALFNNSRKTSAIHKSKAAAVAAAMTAVARGESVDMGLAQINSKNLAALGLSIEEVFDPCQNVAAGAKILGAAYQRSGNLPGALSAYNTGSSKSKIGAVYSAKVFGQAGVVVPAIPGGRVADLPNLPVLNGEILPPVRLTVRPSPFYSGLAPSSAVWGTSGWR